MNKFKTWITELLSDKGYKYRGLCVLNSLYARHVISHDEYMQSKKHFLKGQRLIIKYFAAPVTGPGLFQAKPSALSVKGEAIGMAGAGQPIIEPDNPDNTHILYTNQGPACGPTGPTGPTYEQMVGGSRGR